jgi:hypothetical protein
MATTITSETALCKACDKSYPSSQLKSDDYDSETFFCEKCSVFSLTCEICHKRAVSCYYDGSKRMYMDEDEEKQFYTFDPTIYLYEYTTMLYDTNNRINGTFINTFIPCFICLKLVCTNCFVEESRPSVIVDSVTVDSYVLCNNCEDKFGETLIKEICLRRKCNLQKQKRRKMEKVYQAKISEWEKFFVKQLFTQFPESVCDNIASYL